MTQEPPPPGDPQGPGSSPGERPQGQETSSRPTFPATPAGQQPPPPPPTQRPARGYYEGPWPPEGIAPKKEGFWSLVWRTTTRTTIVAFIGGIVFVIGVFIFFAIMALTFAAIFDFEDDTDPDELETEFLFGDRDSDNKLLAIRVEGLILGERRTDAWFDAGFVYGYEVKDQLRKAAREDDILGVVLMVSTPGGTIFGSHAIADGVREYQEATGKPVLAYVAGLSASGGVWSMAPADRVLADHGSLIGSIGVIMGPFTHYDDVVEIDGGLFFGGVTTRGGITNEYLTAGRSKDVGNPWRPMTVEERAVLQEGLDAEYDTFVSHVEQWYGIPELTIREDMGAHIFGNAIAEAFGLIDGTANMEEAFAELADMAGAPGEDWQVRDVKSGLSFFGSLFESDPPGSATEELLRPANDACFPLGTALMFFGDATQLCWR